MKADFDEIRKKFRKTKNERLQADRLFTLDDTYKIDEPLLKEDNGVTQQRVITREMANMAQVGKDAELVAADTLGELYRNNGTMQATSSKVR